MTYVGGNWFDRDTVYPNDRGFHSHYKGLLGNSWLSHNYSRISCRISWCIVVK